jgi:hypothetical protein
MVFCASVLDDFGRLRKANIVLFMCFSPSVCPCGTTWLTMDEFSLNFVFQGFSKIKVWLKSDSNKGRFA